MVMVFLLPAILSYLLLVAHFLHAGNMGGVMVCLGLGILLRVRRWWAARLAQVVFGLACGLWALTGYGIVLLRIDEGRNWRPSAIIFAVVIVTNVLAIGLFQTRRLGAFYRPKQEPAGGSDTGAAPR